MKKIIKLLYSKIKKTIGIDNSSNEVKKLAVGKLLTKRNKLKKIENIQDIEFKIFSQFGDDGIIQFLIDELQIDYEYQNFIEFGVEDYSEANTKFLLLNNNWSGLILDSSNENIENIKKSNFFLEI